MPYLSTQGVRAAMHMRTDVYLEPVQIPAGYARALGGLGGRLLPNTPVEEILTQGGAVMGVLTSRGEIRARIVVDAAGAWQRKVAALCGAGVKLVPTRHQLMVTVPLPDVRPNQPITRIIDANVYVRPEKDGLMLGGYEPGPVQYDMNDLPANFGIEDLELDVSVLRRLAEEVAVQFPIFKDIALQEHRGGLPTMTADGEHVLGPPAGVDGLFVLGGCCFGGLSTAPARASFWRNGSCRGNRRWTWRSWRRAALRRACRKAACGNCASCNTSIITGRRNQSQLRPSRDKRSRRPWRTGAIAATRSVRLARRPYGCGGPAVAAGRCDKSACRHPASRWQSR